MGSLPVFRPSCPGGAVYKFRASTGNYPFPVGGSGGVSSSGRGSLSGRSGADGRLRPVRLANGGRRGRSGAGAGAPPVSNFYQFPVVFPQFPGGGARIGRPVCRCRWVRRRTSPAGGAIQCGGWGRGAVRTLCRVAAVPSVGFLCSSVGFRSSRKHPCSSPRRRSRVWKHPVRGCLEGGGMGSLPGISPLPSGRSRLQVPGPTGSYPFSVGGRAVFPQAGGGVCQGSGADGGLRLVRPAYGRRGRSGAGAGAPPVSNFYQFPVVFPQFPGGGARIGRPVCRCRWVRRRTSPAGGATQCGGRGRRI